MLNEEDLQKIQAIITASAASLKADLIARQDRAVESTVANISDLRQEMNRRFDRTDQRFDVIERRAERLEVHMQSLILQTAGMSKSLTDSRTADTFAN
jgi:TolA-binding protein